MEIGLQLRAAMSMNLRLGFGHSYDSESLQRCDGDLEASLLHAN